MSLLRSELEQQPQSLKDCIEYYLHQEGGQLLEAIPAGHFPVLTGMGASYHAAWIGALYLNHLGLDALSLEATDLAFYTAPTLGTHQILVYLSQSGRSAEVSPVLEQMGGSTVLAISNYSESPLAKAARYFFPLLAGEEQLVASKTYLNSLVLMWLLPRRLAAAAREPEAGQLGQIAELCEQLVQDQTKPVAVWREALKDVQRLAFIGHGPHAATARQAAMLVNEWTRQPAMAFSAGGLRHGFIESAAPGTGYVLFAPAGASQDSIRGLAAELQGYGAQVLLICNGVACLPDEPLPSTTGIDEFLSPILDILPVQQIVDHTAQQMGLTPGFRHIRKVIPWL